MEFPNSADFMNHLRTIVLSDAPNLSHLLGLYNGINNGCACSRKSRISIFDHHFKELPTKINQTEKDFLKTSLNTENIIVTNIWTISLT